ncbi:ArsR/SmtB family transcription factor [Rhizobium tumorigenes]|uniref:Helix-turn-helix domain-containing protein n=1 Tax=Rhizobium tumorigenes TaxID=2041385 RepID=A0AAF1KW23_9HYPH|nr:helix-turn-helix domain-containing protein [Rhizobium tumorigenes]WFR97631.1 helix-turn-helix domain-containing protein [Rhizobium tumorigenes]
MRIMKHPAMHEISIEQVFYALSDPVRLEIVQKLCVTDEATCSALDGGRPKSSVSHHFRVLREAGLVLTRNEGVSHMNALRRTELDERFPGLLDVVGATIASGASQAAAGAVLLQKQKLPLRSP